MLRLAIYGKERKPQNRECQTSGAGYLLMVVVEIGCKQTIQERDEEATRKPLLSLQLRFGRTVHLERDKVVFRQFVFDSQLRGIGGI